MRNVFAILLALGLSFSLLAQEPDNLSSGNLVAWCIVPFDAKKRGPAQRAAMLKELGITRCAYDWRKEHVRQFEEEIQAYQKQGIEFFAFWGGHEEAFRLFEKYDLQPQVWRTLKSPKEESQEEKVEVAAQAMKELAQSTQAIGCKLGLYNHGGWGGEPANLVAVCLRLREMGFAHVGIVYNWHHGHGRIASWAEDLALMQPYLHCLNLNGMNDDADPKILALGQGAHEQEMLQVVIESGYRGPIGILDHQKELDSKIALQANLDGLAVLKAKVGK
ncbi:MAG: TIM barrel protein [Verrucomicrobiota bacterium]